MHKVSTAKDLPLYFDVLRTPINLDTKDGALALQQKVESLIAVMVVLDLWTDFIDDNENSQYVIKRAVAPLREMAREWNTTFVLVCHSSKAKWNGRDRAFGARGGGHLDGSQDAIFSLSAKKKDDAKRYELAVRCRDSVAELSDPLLLEHRRTEMATGHKGSRWVKLKRSKAEKKNPAVTREAVRKKVVDAVLEFKADNNGELPNTGQLRRASRLGNENAGVLFKDELAEMVSLGLIRGQSAGKAILWDVP